MALVLNCQNVFLVHRKRCCVPAATCPPSDCLVFFGLLPTNHRSTSIVDGFCSSQDSRGDDPARQYSTPIINGLRPAGAGQTQGSCSPGVRPTLTIEDLGTSKPTSCTEFCVAQIKSISPVSIDFVNPVIADHSIDFITFCLSSFFEPNTSSFHLPQPFPNCSPVVSP